MPGSILLTGADGFTGRHFTEAALARGHSVIPLRSGLTDAPGLVAELADASFDYVVHLAAISAVTHDSLAEFYSVNLFGSLNLLSAVAASRAQPVKILLASSANVYGNAPVSPIDESFCPAPVNHYAMSKLAMEHMARSQFSDFPLVVVRPFNYTGVGHDQRFVIPKIVDHYQRRAPQIELGNMEVEREFNDVRTVCQVYLELLDKGQAGETYNICSGRTYCLKTVISMVRELTGHDMETRVNPKFVRASEVHKLSGNPAKLEASVGALQHPPLEETLEWMLGAGL